MGEYLQKFTWEEMVQIGKNSAIISVTGVKPQLQFWKKDFLVAEQRNDSQPFNLQVLLDSETNAKTFVRGLSSC